MLTSSSIGSPSFPIMVAAAARAGFAGLSLWPPETYTVARSDGFTPEQLRTLLDDAGVLAYEVDALVTWAGANDPGEPYLRAAPRAFVLETAGALGAHQANAIVVGERGTSAREVADAVDALCEDAERAGVRVAVEFARGSLVRTLADARALLDALPHRDLGITVDAWQLHWGPSTVDELGAARGSEVYSVQLDDAPRSGPTTSGTRPTKGGWCRVRAQRTSWACSARSTRSATRDR